MATPQQVADLRVMINEPTTDTYSDEVLGARIDQAGSVQEVAAAVWQEKAGRYAELVDIQEGSSRRALGDLHEQALAMAEHYGGLAIAVSGRTRRSRTRPIVRP